MALRFLPPRPIGLTILSFTVLFVCSLLLPTPSRAAVVDLTSTITLDAANDDFPQIPAHTIGPFQLSPCGAAGCFFLDIANLQNGQYRTRLMFSEVPPTGAVTSEQVDSVDTADPASVMATLLYDSNCRPSGVRLWNNSYEYFTRGSSRWQKETLDLDLAAMTGSTNPVTLTHLGAARDADDSLHLLFSYTIQGGASGFVHAVRANGQWTWTRFDPLQSILDVALDPQGAVHAVYSAPDPITFANELRYATSYGGAWSTESVLTPPDIDTEVDLDPRIAVAPDGTVAIVSTYRGPASSAPSEEADLRYTWRRGANDWVSETVASVADGYFGTEGGSFTGGQPDLAFDAESRPHIAFTDLAYSKDGMQRPWYADGQLRYAYWNGTAWELKTLFTQPGPAGVPNPVHELLTPSLVVSPAGGRIHFLAVERTSHSADPVYDTGVARDFRALLFTATNTLGADATPSLLDAILGRTSPVEGMDQNLDGTIDVADLVTSKIR